MAGMAADEPVRLVVCVNPITGPRKQCCGGQGSAALADALAAGIRERRLRARVERVYCLNNCYRGPSMRISGGRFFFHVGPDDVPTILDELESVAGRDADEDFGMAYPGG